MEKILIAESMSKSHWVWDNDYTSAKSKENISQEDVDFFNQQIKADPHLLHTQVKKSLSSNTEVNQRTKLNIEIPYSSGKFNIFKKKLYTKNNKTWKGVISDVKFPLFKARLYDLDDHLGTYEVADFNIKTDITEQDLELVCVGAIFYWSVGNVVKNKTQTKRSEIRMRRVADITPSEFDELHDGIDASYGNIIWK